MEEFAAHDLSDAALGGPISIQDGQFVDGYGRILSLHGLNVSGASKLPTEPNGLSHLTEGFYEHRTVTFKNRPFPLGEAPLHFRRLKAWGLPLVRLLVTWESIGHSGPNPDTDLDLEYISYLRALLKLMPHYGIKCFICAHQDVWSRFSGGSGAPGWTFEAAGLDIEAFTDTGAAYVHGQDEKKRASAPVNEKEPSGPFVWPSGYQKLAASTMATLFWAGDALAPDLRCRRKSSNGDSSEEEVSIQTLLQDAFIEAFGRLADEVADLEAYIGFEPLNEPHRGLINLHDFHSWNYDTDLHIGYFPSLAQALALGSGHAQTVRFYVKSWPFPTRVSHQSRMDPKGRSAWLPQDDIAKKNRLGGMGQCIWRAHGVWKWDPKTQSPVILQSDYFDYDHRPGHEGSRIEWYRDFYAPFVHRLAQRVSRKNPRQLAFVEPIPNEFIPPWPPEGSKMSPETQQQTYAVKTVIDTVRPRNFVYAPHFYDLNVLFSKTHNWMSVNVQGLSRGMFVLKGLYFGARGLRKNYKTQIANVVRWGKASLGTQVPMIIGEVGIPFDINGSLAFTTGCYDKQRELMHALISAMEDNFIGFTLWNYNPHNGIEHGDGWNNEDFSLLNGDEIEDGGALRPDYRNHLHEKDELYRGGRVLDVVIRPYAVKIAGNPVRSTWDCDTLRYEFEWTTKGSTAEGVKDIPSKSQVTEIFIPHYHYGAHTISVDLSDGDWYYYPLRQTMFVWHRQHQNETVSHSIVITIQDQEQHVAQQVQERRQKYPPKFPASLATSIVEFMEHGVNFSYFLTLLLVVAAGLALLITRYGK
ncbi:hypothetical protein G7046_g2932 [Stylonectria norvegica]|nr:hypothetical protein G7046_g2932 [Stylonectria norvegica]